MLCSQEGTLYVARIMHYMCGHAGEKNLDDSACLDRLTRLKSAAGYLSRALRYHTLARYV